MESGRKNPAKALLKAAGKNGGSLTEATFFGLFPEARGWLTSTFATPTSAG